MSQGKIIKVSGPLVVADGLADANMQDVVRVGEQRLIGEILNMTGDRASIQVYEETSGLGPGAVVESTWKDAAGQIKTVVNNVVFPALDMILVIALFGKAGLSYFDYKKHGQFEWTGPVILFVCLILTLLAPTYIWTIIGI